MVLAIRDSKPTKPDELMFAVQTLFDIGRTDEAKLYLKKLLAAQAGSRRAGRVPPEVRHRRSSTGCSRDHRMKPEGEQLARAVLDAAYAGRARSRPPAEPGASN